MTNQEIADALRLKKTVVRMKAYELGLQRMQLEYWTPVMVKYLKDNYKSKGDVEIMNYFKKHYPKSKGWKRNAIHKKRKYLKLHRTEKQLANIIRKNCAKGGPSYTIDKNSSSKNMHSRWVAQQIAWRNPQLQKELIKHPDIIELAKLNILLNREIKKKTA